MSQIAAGIIFVILPNLPTEPLNIKPGLWSKDVATFPTEKFSNCLLRSKPVENNFKNDVGDRPILGAKSDNLEGKTTLSRCELQLSPIIWRERQDGLSTPMGLESSYNNWDTYSGHRGHEFDDESKNKQTLMQ